MMFQVEWAEQMVEKRRVKRGFVYPRLFVPMQHRRLFNDPLWEKQWYMHDTRLMPDVPKIDLNVIEAWNMGYTGKGIVVTVIDDGKSKDSEASWDANDNDPDPMARYDPLNINAHGTRCAGEIAMVANNKKCGVGVAFNSKIGGIRMLDGSVTDATEGVSLGFNVTHIDIYSASWGPSDDGRTVDGPGKLAQKALEKGITKGRNGKGVLYIWAAGNGGMHGDNCNCDGYTSSIYTLSIGSASQQGRFPWYGEMCASTMASTYSSGAYSDQKISTADLRDSCTTQHTGTSASAPLAAGIFALVLEANGNITWRDAQHLAVWTSSYEAVKDNIGWNRNAQGFLYNTRFGFGLMNVISIVKAAKSWVNVPEKHICEIEPKTKLPFKMNQRKITQIHFTSDGCKNKEMEVNYLEHTQVEATIKTPRRGALTISLTSPSGTVTTLLTPRTGDVSTSGFKNWYFMSVHLWGENPTGNWVLRINNTVNISVLSIPQCLISVRASYNNINYWQQIENISNGEVVSMKLILHGTKEIPEYLKNGPRKYKNERDVSLILETSAQNDSLINGSSKDDSAHDLHETSNLRRSNIEEESINSIIVNDSVKEHTKLGAIQVCVFVCNPVFSLSTNVLAMDNSDIGKLMAGSGLEEVFEEVYAEHTVVHMFSGKAVARSLRAHMLVQGALVSHLINALVDEGKIDPLQLESVYKKAIMTGLKKDELIEFGNGDVFSHIEKMISEYTLTKKDASRTAKLWLLYMNYVSIVKKFLIAERTSNWCLHIQAVTKMMNLFAASGHLHYAKSFRIYVQEMLTMSETNSWLYHQFQEGQHDVRRSGRFWAGLWSDLVIEQTLMRSIKSSGGLTRGRGFEENVRHLWVSSISYTAAVHEAMSSLSGVKASSSEQHAEMEFKRRSRDYTDLHSLSTGSVSVCGTDNVNCENAESIGECIQKSIDEVNFTEAKIKKKDQLCNLNMMTTIAQREEDVEQYFDFELTTRPQSLFKNELMRKPDKASLRKVLLTEEIQCSANEVMEITGKYVLDGGALLHRVHWVKGIKFNEVAKAYVNYIRRNYGSAFIVFDGYDSPESIKSNEHLRRAGSKGSTPNIIITEDNEVPYTKERFLSNSHNKTQLISFLADHLTLDGQAVHICRGDADTKIVSTALEVANDSTTIVVADDTDVAVMLLYHWNENISDVFFFKRGARSAGA
ncbi:Neuroendocrine convertase 1 [Nymphon striatum]|nr:Neuroendocrine convertase 1 [Nymphon striatum]